MRDKGNPRRRQVLLDRIERAEAALAAHLCGGAWPAERVRQAIDRINPSPKCLARCENEVVRALLSVDLSRSMDIDKSMISNGAYRKVCNKVAKALRTIGANWDHCPPEDPVTEEWVVVPGEIKKYREIVERRIESLPRHHGSKQRSRARQSAANCAYRLLYNFGKRPPALSHEGEWQKLATILYGDGKADLYKYLKTSTRPTSLLFDVNAHYTVTFSKGRSRKRRC
jgi:hypothetical protein